MIIFFQLFLTLLLPLLVGILFFWLVFGKKYSGFLLYIYSFLFGVGYIAFGTFLCNLLYSGFGFGIAVYLLLFLLLFVGLVIKILISSFDYISLIKSYFSSLFLSFSGVKNSYLSLSSWKKITVWLMIFYVFVYLLIGLVHVTHFPSYHIDSYLHWNAPVFHMLQQQGAFISQYSGENYPFFIAIFKTLILSITGGNGFQVIGVNIFQWLIFLSFLLFVVSITWQKTKNILFSLLPLVLICSLPLIYFQVVDGYVDLTISVYIVVILYLLYSYLEKGSYDDLLLSWSLMCISVFLKNDGLFVYIPVVLFVFSFLLLLRRQFLSTMRGFFSSSRYLFLFLFMLFYFVLPYLIFKITLQSAASSSLPILLSTDIHTDIFSLFPMMFFHMDNYNVILILLTFFFFLFFSKKLYRTSLSLLFFVPIGLFFHVLFSVFLFSGNYIWALNQTVTNRIFSMIFLMLVSFAGFYLHKKNT